MAKTTELNAQQRESRGKGAARAIRREGRVPAVIYGDKQDPISISLDYVDVLKAVNTGQFLSTVYMINVEGGKTTRVIPRDVQLDPVMDFPMHADFLRIAKDAKLEVEITVHFINEEECPGLKAGGVLNVVRHEVELSCPADAIPDSIDLDIGSLDIGDTLHASDLKLPASVALATTDHDFTIVSVVGQMAEEVEFDPDAAAATEGEDEEGAEGEGEGEGDKEE